MDNFNLLPSYLNRDENEIDIEEREKLNLNK
jgi:hypothetical protein